MTASNQDPYRLRLVVTKKTEFQASWIDPDGQPSESFPLELPLSENNTSDLRWYLETYHQFPGAGDHVRAKEIEGRLAGWGRALFDAVFGSPEGVHVYRNLVAAVAEGRPGLVTIGAGDPEILAQPWEMMRDKRGPLVFQGVTVRRQLVGTKSSPQPKLKLPLRVLLIVSRPSDTSFIDPRDSIEPIFDALDALPVGQVDVDFCEPPTLARLEKVISEARKENRPFGIVHFDGHGTYLPKTGVGALAFEKGEDDDKTELVQGTRLGDLLSRLAVPIVLLEACRSSDLSDRPVFGSVAPALLESGVGSVLAFSHAVHVKAARLFVERFYGELTDGLTVGQALEEARASLRADPHRWLHRGPDPETIPLQDWFIPQLYQVGSDPALVKKDGDGTTKPAAPSVRDRTKDLHGFPPEPMYRFHGRALELRELERAFRRVPAVVLTAMGGMGKTALAREAAAWWLRTKRFEAAIFHSFEQKAGADRVVQVLGQALEGDDFSRRSEEEQWTSAVDLFHQRKVLVVWDNFESTLPEFQKGSSLEFGQEERQRLRKLYRELTQGDPTGRLLVTCRPQKTGLAGIKKIPLSGLARPDSLHLLSAVLFRESISTDRDGYDREAIEAWLKALDDHPLSISLVAPHLKTLTPARILEELRKDLDRFTDASAAEGRNRSLLASLAFSTRRLSEEARGVLPYLAWFEGGTFESRVRSFTQLDAEVWESIRGELVATTLIQLEEVGFTSPFLRFHPTLPFAARPYEEPPSGWPAEDVGNPEAVEKRFIEVYLTVGKEAHQALRGSQPAAGMALLALDEGNFRSALQRVFRRGARQDGTWMAETLGEYLQRAGRLRERNDLVAWVHSQQPEAAALDGAACNAIRQHALGLLSRGRAAEAIATVQDLIARLEAEGLAGGEEPAFEIATSCSELGRICVDAHRPELGLESSQRAIALLEGLPGDIAKGNLAAAGGSLANSYRALGRFDEALAVSERVLAIFQDMGKKRDIAVGLGQIAHTLMEQRRYPEADVRYAEALAAGQAAGDLALQGATLQQQAAMQRQMGNPRQAVVFGKKALTFFQKAGDEENEMMTCDLLGSAEKDLKQFAAADAWFGRSLELAEKRNDRYHLAVVLQNVGVLQQAYAEQASDPEARTVHLLRAVSSIEKSLAIKLEREDQIAAASSYCGLGALHLLLGDLDRAEKYLQQGLSIFEALNLPDVHAVYHNMALVARARGDDNAATEWQAKYDAKVAELRRLRRGNGMDVGVPAQLRDGILELARGVHDARSRGVSLSPDASEALAQLSDQPAPLGSVGVFLREVADGALPAVPSGLPAEVGEILEELRKVLDAST